MQLFHCSLECFSDPLHSVCVCVWGGNGSLSHAELLSVLGPFQFQSKLNSLSVQWTLFLWRLTCFSFTLAIFRAQPLLVPHVIFLWHQQKGKLSCRRDSNRATDTDSASSCLYTPSVHAEDAISIFLSIFHQQRIYPYPSIQSHHESAKYFCQNISI